MASPNWRFGVAANITEYHLGDDGKEYRGTKAFTAGTKVYLAGKNWDKTSRDIAVIGRNRFGRIVLERVSVDCLENLRMQRIYKPHILDIISYEETMESWPWWKRTSSDRKETEEFVETWRRNLADHG